MVKAPPRLSAKPRGSERKAKKTPKLQPSETPPTNMPMRGLKHKRDIEEEREKIISQYRLAKRVRLANTKDRT